MVVVAQLRDWRSRDAWLPIEPPSKQGALYRYVRLGLYPNEWAGTAVARTQGGYGELNQ